MQTERLSSFFQTQLREHTLSHAYLLEGEDSQILQREVLNLSKTLFCLGKESLYCDRCTHCLRFDRQIHVDLLRVRPEKNHISIEAVRSILRYLATPPQENDKKIVWIEAAEKMGMEAANALLKTLEEPPTYALFLLTTCNEHRVIDTLRSRCQIRHYDGVSPVSARREQALDMVAGLLTPQAIRNALAYAETLSGETAERDEWMREFLWIFKEALLTRAGKEKPLHPTIGELAKRGDTRLLILLERIEQLQKEFQRNVNFQLTLEELFITIVEVTTC